MADVNSRLFECPWCSKRFPDLSARYHHTRASHRGVQIELVEFDLVNGEQAARHGELQPIGDVVRPIVARVNGNG